MVPNLSHFCCSLDVFQSKNFLLQLNSTIIDGIRNLKLSVIQYARLISQLNFAFNKHSSLFVQSINDEGKSYIVWTTVCHIFSSCACFWSKNLLQLSRTIIDCIRTLIVSVIEYVRQISQLNLASSKHSTKHQWRGKRFHNIHPSAQFLLQFACFWSKNLLQVRHTIKDLIRNLKQPVIQHAGLISHLDFASKHSKPICLKHQ